ncbi:type III secretion system chaperone [Morganella sp. GD04133]|uniref:type III secretion system chaperone n=1 Tax=Morganella sp. GD04133 TaxID=2975435 RepID=UPI002447B540|nr:type III secretion system chaperone [Morganella sp. GD04133]MDH0355451.1 type III secretion system chaperone [Morganella sp. GD04133]
MHQKITDSRLHQIAPELGSRPGFEGLAFDEGCLTFTFGETVVLVEEVREGFVLTGFVDSLPDETSERLLAACLISNLNAVKSDFPVISVEETTRSLILQRWSHAGTAEELIAAMEQFSGQIGRVRDSVCRFSEKIDTKRL